MITIFNFEVIEVPQCNSADIFIVNCNIHIVDNNLCLILQGPFRICLIGIPLVDACSSCLRDNEGLAESSIPAGGCACAHLSCYLGPMSLWSSYISRLIVPTRVVVERNQRGV